MNIQNNSSKVPLYRDLYLKLREKIESGEYPVGSRLPSEKLISEEHSVSRITSKHALDQLAGEGFIKRFPGKGSFVQAQFPAAPVAQPASAPDSSGNSRLIGVVMENLQSDFGMDLLAGIEQQCAEAGYSFVLKFSYGSEAREKACVEELLDVGVSGILLMCVYSEVYSATVMKLSLDGFPLVFMDRSLNGLPVPYVGTNHQEAAAHLTRALIERNHQNIVLAMTEDSHTTSSAEERVQGYVQSCLDNNLLCANKRLLLLHEDVQNPQAEIRLANIRRTREYLQSNPETTAILSLSAEVTSVILHALDKNSASRYTFASFDGPKDIMNNPYELLYIAQGQKAIGRTACAQLIDKIGGKEAPTFTQIPYQLVINAPESLDESLPPDFSSPQ